MRRRRRNGNRHNGCLHIRGGLGTDGADVRNCCDHVGEVGACRSLLHHRRIDRRNRVQGGAAARTAGSASSAADTTRRWRLERVAGLSDGRPPADSAYVRGQTPVSAGGRTAPKNRFARLARELLWTLNAGGASAPGRCRRVRDPRRWRTGTAGRGPRSFEEAASVPARIHCAEWSDPRRTDRCSCRTATRFRSSRPGWSFYRCPTRGPSRTVAGRREARPPSSRRRRRSSRSTSAWSPCRAPAASGPRNRSSFPTHRPSRSCAGSRNASAS